MCMSVAGSRIESGLLQLALTSPGVERCSGPVIKNGPSCSRTRFICSLPLLAQRCFLLWTGERREPGHQQQNIVRRHVAVVSRGPPSRRFLEGGDAARFSIPRRARNFDSIVARMLLRTLWLEL